MHGCGVCAAYMCCYDKDDVLWWSVPYVMLLTFVLLQTYDGKLTNHALRTKTLLIIIWRTAFDDKSIFVHAKYAMILMHPIL